VIILFDGNQISRFIAPFGVCLMFNELRSKSQDVTQHQEDLCACKINSALDGTFKYDLTLVGLETLVISRLHRLQTLQKSIVI